MRRFCLQNVESILGVTKRDLPQRTDPFYYIRELNYSSTAACAALHLPKVIQWYVSKSPHHTGCIWNHNLVLMVSKPCEAT